MDTNTTTTTTTTTTKQAAEKAALDRAIYYLDAVQMPDGRWAYDVDTEGWWSSSTRDMVDLGARLLAAERAGRSVGRAAYAWAMETTARRCRPPRDT